MPGDAAAFVPLLAPSAPSFPAQAFLFVSLKLCVALRAQGLATRCLCRECAAWQLQSLSGPLLVLFLRSLLAFHPAADLPFPVYRVYDQKQCVETPFEAVWPTLAPVLSAELSSAEIRYSDGALGLPVEIRPERVPAQRNTSWTSQVSVIGKVASLAWAPCFVSSSSRVPDCSEPRFHRSGGTEYVATRGCPSRSDTLLFTVCTTCHCMWLGVRCSKYRGKDPPKFPMHSRPLLRFALHSTNPLLCRLIRYCRN